MKGFLFDENISVPLRFLPSLPIVHVTSLGRSLSDDRIWTFAAEKELVIVSKDADFADRMMHADSPPWVIQLRFGNIRRAAFDAILAAVWPRVELLLPAHKLTRVFPDRIESVRNER